MGILAAAIIDAKKEALQRAYDLSTTPFVERDPIGATHLEVLEALCYAMYRLSRLGWKPEE